VGDEVLRKFTCQNVQSSASGGLTVHLTCFDLEHLSEILIKAPDKMFEDNEMPIQNKEYFVKLIETPVSKHPSKDQKS
jgi:hypothetical protein